jgi:hypothetical protein
MSVGLCPDLLYDGKISNTHVNSCAGCYPQQLSVPKQVSDQTPEKPIFLPLVPPGGQHNKRVVVSQTHMPTNRQTSERYVGSILSNSRRQGNQRRLCWPPPQRPVTLC